MMPRYSNSSQPRPWPLRSNQWITRPRPRPKAQPSSAPPAIGHARSCQSQRVAPTPRSPMPSRPSASSTTGNAVPSFRPPSAVSDTRTASRSLRERICTSEASTGSVGARMPASSSAPAQPSAGISQTPASVANAIVTSMLALARIAATRQPLSVQGTRSCRPTANSEISTAVSVTITSMSARSGAVGGVSTLPCTIAPATQPTAR